MAQYVDGFVIPLAKDRVKDYQRIAKKAAKIWLEHGALEVRECVGDDLVAKMGIPFAKLTKLKPGETVVFSWIVYPSRSRRDKVNARVMKDPRITAMCDPKDMPFDCGRMSYGGFKTLVAE